MSAAVGARLIFATLGARGQMSVSSIGRRYSLGPEAGVHAPFGRVEPRVRVGLGYTSFDVTCPMPDATSVGLHIDGFYVRTTLGVDYYLSPMFSIGADASLEWMTLARGKLGSSTIDQISASSQATLSDLTVRTTSAGGAFAMTFGAGVHF